MIKLRNVHKYFGHIQVLKGINLDISAKEVVAIIGPQRFWQKHPTALHQCS